MSIEAAIAMNRFGIGARGNETMSAKPQSWLLDQLGWFQARPVSLTAMPDRASLAASFNEYQMDRKENKQARQEQPPAENMTEAQKKAQRQPNPGRKEIRGIYDDAVKARLNSALASEAGFAERLVHFWSNHFAVSIDKLPVVAFAGNYEFEAIRPHIMSKFSDLLFAATHHPAMLLYLDQAQSIGPQSALAQRVAARRNKELGLNENLAREIMELHSLGVRTGYSQADVTEFARALTGTTVAGLGKGPLQKLISQSAGPGETIFVEPLHEPGKRTVMGKSYAQAGAAQSAAIISDLAAHPATARHIATKLAQHFISDVPPPALVARLEQGFQKSGGDLPTLYRILVEAPEAWVPEQAKFKTPWEWVVSSLRALDIRELPANVPSVGMFAQMGQPVWKPGSPAGFSDLGENWAGGAALMRRVEIASRLSERSANRVDARSLGPKILPGQLSDHSAQWISRAESPAQGLALLLVSPEFLRR